ncbi:hypothetical protein [Rhizosphaericola mali]|uniref:hypothetical protein n=1 Tax=Rhizosphaericola mali TaxID=2545455 RepID=UPI00178570AC|nr:hypothetical protein [Rhizosphaericola mali]
MEITKTADQAQLQVKQQLEKQYKEAESEAIRSIIKKKLETVKQSIYNNENSITKCPS